jgi:hypothetical protein
MRRERYCSILDEGNIKNWVNHLSFGQQQEKCSIKTRINQNKNSLGKFQLII